MYCVRFKSGPCSVGYIRPWNSVRDGETYSLTYLPTSFINGIEMEQQCVGKILRHKLRFKGMTSELFVSEKSERPRLYGGKKTKHYEWKLVREPAISVIHQLSCPEIILGFEKREDAEKVSKNCLYVGQEQYMIYPSNFYDEEEILDDIVVELSEEEFSKLSGTETFPSTEDDEEAVYCGNNRQKNNERMYIKIVRTK